jgi:hypothetical protein
MSGINFKVLVEQVLFESLETELTPVIRGGTDQFKFDCAHI